MSCSKAFINLNVYYIKEGDIPIMMIPRLLLKLNGTRLFMLPKKNSYSFVGSKSYFPLMLKKEISLIHPISQ
jgi:hypothetical protein